MKFFHLADLHLGKRVNGFPMIEDQKYILNQVIELADREQPDAVIIAGDVYDKSIPSVEAVNLMDDFLVELMKRKLQIFIISGNHDSAERVSYGGRIMEQSGIHISPRFTGAGRSASGEENQGESNRTEEYGNQSSAIRPICMEDEYGPLYIYLIPYIHPSVVREAYPEEKIADWTQAMDVLIRNAHVDPKARNIAVSHQYVTSSGVRPEECDSEQKHIGGLDNVDYSVFDDFDYVALGHLHGPQRIGRDTVRYAGSPLKYSFSEEKHKKSVTLVELKEKGQVEYSLLPLTAARDFKTLRGRFNELMSPEFTARLSSEDYYRIILTDEQDIDQALGRLRRYFYRNLMDLAYDNIRTRTQSEIDAVGDNLEKEPIDVVQELFLKQNGTPLNDFQARLASQLIKEIWDADV